MKVGTDAVLLGAWTNAGKAGEILEIGTGCGVIALMLAQRSNAWITAIDNDPDSIQQAGENFIRSPWKERLQAVHVDIRVFDPPGIGFHLIIANPPFFSRSLKSPSEKKNKAKQSKRLDLGELLLKCNRVLQKSELIIRESPASYT